MAIHSDYGSQTEKLSGKWVNYDYDSKINKWAQLFVRPLTEEARNRIRKPFLKVTRRRGRAPSLEIPDESREDFGKEILLWQWANTKNFWIWVGNEESAKFWSVELNQEVKPKTEVCIDGKLTDRIRYRLVEQDITILDKIGEASRMEVATVSEQKEVEEVLRKNSSTGSAGRSAGQMSMKNGAESAESLLESEEQSDNLVSQTHG